MHPRIAIDVKKLKKSGVEIIFDNPDVINTFIFILHGPKDSLYEGGKWRVRVHIPSEYPFKSPSVGFIDKILHPNVDLRSGSICLDVLNQTWTPIFNLSHIHDTFLPQLLLYPNADDPMNEHIAIIMIEAPEDYKKIIRNSIVEGIFNYSSS